MARIARVVVPGAPHHVTQRGNRREATFFSEADYRLYRDLLGAAATKANTEIWAYCLMPNHVHGVVVPCDEDGLRRAAPELYAIVQRASRVDGPSLAVALRLGPNG